MKNQNNVVKSNFQTTEGQAADDVQHTFLTTVQESRSEGCGADVVASSGCKVH